MNSVSSSLEATQPDAAVTPEVTLESFAPYVGEKFEMQLDGGRSEPLELVTARAYNRKVPEGFREPFELILRAGTRNFYVPQGIYSFQHPAAGTFEIFIVPIGPDAAGMQFQAIFS